MIYKNIEFFNVSELEEVQGFNGVSLQRFPKAVRDAFGSTTNEKGRLVSMHSTGSEIRFVTESKYVRLFLSTVDADGEVLVYRGNFFHSKHSLKAGRVAPINLEEPTAFKDVKEASLEVGHFSSKVWRILFNRTCVAFHGIDTFGHAVRPPEENEVPKIKWLAYGSSITQGASSQSFENSYLQQAAKRLKVDVKCCGLSGACFCEKEVADFIATKAEWDLVTLEIGVNMRSSFTTEEFKERATYLIKTIIENNPEKPVIIVSIFSNHQDYTAIEDNIYAVRSREYNEVLKKIYLQFKNPYLFLIDGKDMLTDFTALTCDLLHPSAYGHILIGENLAGRLRPIINSLVLPKYDSFTTVKQVVKEKQIRFLDSVVWLQDVEIGKGGEKTLKMDIVMPSEQTAEPLPAIVYIHGGGWNHGSKDDHLMKLVGIAKRGYVAVAIQYRLTHEAIFPGQLEDCKLAIRYLRGRAKTYNIDIDRIGVWGNSAGGHLAALLGTTKGIPEFEGNGGWQEFSSEVNAVVDWSGPVDFSTEYSNNYSSVTKLLGVRAFDDKERALKAMPTSYITEETPAFLIFHGDKDNIVPYTQSITLYEALKSKGVDVTFKLLKGEGHNYASKEPEIMTMDFFDNELKKQY
jgi:acetyl esterase/lipase/lysophospholipase L1-like esterase